MTKSDSSELAENTVISILETTAVDGKQAQPARYVTFILVCNILNFLFYFQVDGANRRSRL